MHACINTYMYRHISCVVLFHARVHCLTHTHTYPWTNVAPIVCGVVGQTRQKCVHNLGATPNITMRPMPLYATCHAYEQDTSHIYMRHVTNTNETCETYIWVMSQIWIRYVKLYISHVTHVNETRHTCTWVMSESKIWATHITRKSTNSTLSPLIVCEQSVYMSNVRKQNIQSNMSLYNITISVRPKPH